MSMGKGWMPMMDKGGGKGKGKGKGKSIASLKQSLITAGALPGGKFAEENKSNALFIGGLPNDTNTEDLYEIFAPFGAIAARGCRVMYDDFGQCKGFGFVNYLDPTIAANAIMSLNG